MTTANEGSRRAASSHRFPDLVVVGAPRCGTTSLHRWLSSHPSVLARPKDSFYLMDRASGLFRPGANIHEKGLGGYAAPFDKARPEQVTVDSGAGYLYQTTAREVLTSLPSSPVLVAVVRDPVERLRSVYEYSVHNTAALPTTMSFESYVESLIARSLNMVPDETVREAIQQGEYVVHLRRWAEALNGRARIELIEFSTLKREPAFVMTRLASRIGLSGVFYNSFNYQAHNQSRVIGRSRWHRLSRSAGRRVPPGPTRDRLVSLYHRLNTADRPLARPSSSGHTATDEALAHHYAPFNDALKREFGVDISHWTRPGI